MKFGEDLEKFGQDLKKVVKILKFGLDLQICNDLEEIHRSKKWDNRYKWRHKDTMNIMGNYYLRFFWDFLRFGMVWHWYVPRENHQLNSRLYFCPFFCLMWFSWYLDFSIISSQSSSPFPLPYPLLIPYFWFLFSPFLCSTFSIPSTPPWY